ncbi:MAG: 5'/3'-nucleotidase SurE [Nitrospinae bacterium]|nr:5'/3'-nucleotidase SurE [Nitrospinota bacterium]
MKILLSNDDGINAKGIEAMRDALEKIGDVFVVAPETEMSAVGHAITITDPLRVRRVMRDGALFGIAVDGTPADCVKIAARAILTERPDIVVSGINQGQNVATNVIYSGTVSAATEGMILGIPSIAISLASFTSRDFSAAAEYGVKMVRMVLEKGLPEGVLLNVNVPAIPADKIKGVKVCRMGISKFREVFDKRVDPKQNDYYWQGGEMVLYKEDSDADIGFLEEGYVTVTPIHFDLTHREFMENMKGWGL